MDPEATTDILKDAVLALEKSLTIYPWPPGYAEDLRYVRDDAWDAIDNMQDWKARGGFVPRRFWETWEPRFTRVMIDQRDKGGIGWGR